MTSILTSIKKLLGITEEYEHFDADIIMHINSVLMVLNQLGVGPREGFRIEDKTSNWTDFLGDSILLESVKTYIYMRVRLLFDSTTLSGTVIESMKQTISELEWRLNAAVDVVADTDSDTGSEANPGTNDYNQLINLPSINGETLKGNYDEKDPTVDTMTPSEVDSAWKKIFSD